MISHYKKMYFLLSVADVKQLPPDNGFEVALVGRSNAGKSSVLNRLANQKSLARVSKTPGRTQLINLFAIDEAHRLADLPGYGFADVPLSAKLKWQQLIDRYISMRHSLRGLLLIMDIRHPLKALDAEVLAYCETRQFPVHILLNKMDKLSKNAAMQTLLAVKSVVSKAESPITVQLFSAQTGFGIKELYVLLNQWYGYNAE